MLDKWPLKSRLHLQKNSIKYCIFNVTVKIQGMFDRYPYLIDSLLALIIFFPFWTFIFFLDA